MGFSEKNKSCHGNTLFVKKILLSIKQLFNIFEDKFFPNDDVIVQRSATCPENLAERDKI